MFGKIQQSTNPTSVCSMLFSGNVSSSSVALMAMTLGVPGVNPSLCFTASLPSFFSRLLIMDGCPNQSFCLVSGHVKFTTKVVSEVVFYSYRENFLHSLLDIKY